MKTFIAAGCLAALGFAGQATAQTSSGTLSYSYVEVGYVSTELDDFNVDGDGFALKGSWGFTDRFHAFAEYVDLGFDFGIDSSAFEIGGGYNWPMTPRMDLIGTVSYLNAEVDVRGPGFRGLSADEDGLGIGLGLRGLVTDQFELGGKIDYVDFDDSGDDTSFTVGARYYLTPMFALGGDLNFDDDGTTWVIGGRISFR